MKDVIRCSNQWLKEQFMNAANGGATNKLRISREAKLALFNEIKHYAQYLGVTALKIAEQVTKKRTITADTIDLAAQYFKGFARGAKDTS